MSRVTKAQLAADNAALRKALGDLQHVSSIREDVIDGLHAQITDLNVQLTGNKAGHRASSLPAHMQAAKDMAVRSGLTVRVGTREYLDIDARR